MCDIRGDHQQQKLSNAKKTRQINELFIFHDNKVK